MKHLNLAGLLSILALCSLASADPLIFTGHGETDGPPFPTSSVAIQVRDETGTPLQALYINIPTATSGSGLNLTGDSGGPVAHINNSKLEIYDFPGQYSQRFDGLDPGGDHARSTVLANVFNSGQFDVQVQLDLPPDSPYEHLYYDIRGRIGPDQPITFYSVSAVASPEGFFDLNLSFLQSGDLSTDPVVQIDILGSTTAFPEPSALVAAVLAALLALPARRRYHRRLHG